VRGGELLASEYQTPYSIVHKIQPIVISSYFMELEYSLQLLKEPGPLPSPEQADRVQFPALYLFIINFITILPALSKSSKWFLPFSFYDRNCLYAFFILTSPVN
jgi:hypothetical protein